MDDVYQFRHQPRRCSAFRFIGWEKRSPRLGTTQRWIRKPVIRIIHAASKLSPLLGGEGQGEGGRGPICSEFFPIGKTSNIQHPMARPSRPSIGGWALNVECSMFSILAGQPSPHPGPLPDRSAFIHLITPRLEVNDNTLNIAKKLLVQPRERADFETLAAQRIWHGQKLKTPLAESMRWEFNAKPQSRQAAKLGQRNLNPLAGC